MAEVDNFGTISCSNELVSEAYSEKWQFYFSNHIHLLLEDHSGVGFGQHEIGTGKNNDVRVLLQDNLAEASGRVVENLRLISCADRYVVKSLFRLFRFFVVVDYQNLQSRVTGLRGACQFPPRCYSS